MYILNPLAPGQGCDLRIVQHCLHVIPSQSVSLMSAWQRGSCIHWTSAHGRQYSCILWPCLTLQNLFDLLLQWLSSFIISSQDSEHQFCNVRHGYRILECSLNFATVQCVHERASYPCNRKTGRSGWHRLWCIGEGARQCLSAPLPCNSTWHFIFYEDNFLRLFSQYLMCINCTYHSAL